ncbi:hypothetical protein JXL83_06800, partial [candidate division WOR-3 bacterium]|nr:hypothetical protein [candidate division WOR-3 bacterium]
SFPFILQKLSVVVITKKEDIDDNVITGELIIKNKQIELQRIPFEIKYNGKIICRSIIRIDGFIIPSPEDIDFIFEYNKKEIEKKTLKVLQLPVKPIIES